MMPPMPPDDELDDLIEQITVDAYGDEGYWSFCQAFEDGVQFPFAAIIAGVPGVVRLLSAYKRWLGMT